MWLTCDNQLGLSLWYINNVQTCSGKLPSRLTLHHIIMSPDSPTTELSCSVTNVTVTLLDVNDNSPQWILKEFIIGQSSHVTTMWPLSISLSVFRCKWNSSPQWYHWNNRGGLGCTVEPFSEGNCVYLILGWGSRCGRFWVSVVSTHWSFYRTGHLGGANWSTLPQPGPEWTPE